MTATSPVTGPSPRALPFLSGRPKAALDPYMALIVGYRKSGLSLNHIIGCPLDCGYCVRHFWGNFDVKVPHLLCPTGDAIGQLTTHPAFQPHSTPIQLLNKATDPFLPAVKPHLFQILRALDQRGYANHVLIITRFTVTSHDMAEREELAHLRVTLLFTYSGITDARIEPIAKSTITLTSIRTATACKQRTGVVLYWRPIVPGWNDAPPTMAGVLEIGRLADAIVFTGYYHKPENASYLRGLGVDVPYDGHARRKVMPRDLDARVIAAWRESGISTPLFRKTSCGVAYTHAAPDYNGHWGANSATSAPRPSATAAPATTPSQPPPTWTRSSPTSATRPRTSSRTATSGPTASASRSGTPSSTPCGTRSGNSTSPTTSTPTAGHHTATPPTLPSKARSPPSGPGSRPPAATTTTSQARRPRS
jgi:DNA repair photolyase